LRGSAFSELIDRQPMARAWPRATAPHLACNQLLEEKRMVKQTRFSIWFLAVVVLLLALFAGCGGDDDDGDGHGDKTEKRKPVAGTFVGRIPETEAFVSVVASPPAEGRDKRDVTVFVCDARRVCELFSGSAAGNRFTATSDGNGEAEGTLSGKAATGSVELPDGETVRYRAGAAPATAGVYDLTVSAAGKLRGASAAGVALKGESTLPPPGSGSLKLADGTRRKFEVTKSSAEDAAQLRAGQVRLIVLPDGQMRGAGKSRRGGSDFFIASA